jgi:hypothetical protein
VYDGQDVVVNKSWASAWCHQLTREVFETEEAAVADMHKHSDTKLAYETFDMARAALASLCIDKYGQPEGFTCVIQEGMNDEPDVYLEEYRGLVEAGDEEPEQYHPSSHEFGVVYRVGWRPLLNRIARVFRVRDEPRTDREQLKKLDRITQEQDPWVTFVDSLDSGNCSYGTADFVNKIKRFLQETVEAPVGELGAVRSSFILSKRDDAYTRRACRLAAQKLVPVE